MDYQINKILKLKEWWESKFPDKPLVNIKELSGGQLNDVFLLNNEVVLKVYLNEFARYESELKAILGLEKSDIVPKLLISSDNDTIIKKPIIVMSYVEGIDLSSIYHTLSDIQKNTILNEQAGLIRKFNHLQTKQFAEIDLSKRYNKVYNLYLKVKSGLPDEIDKFTEDFFNKQDNKTKVLNLYFTHGDIHLGNFIMNPDEKIKIIDLEFAKLADISRELQTIIASALIPADFTSKELEQYYPNGSLVNWLFELVKLNKYLIDDCDVVDLQLVLLKRVLQKFDPNIVEKEIPLERGKYLFDAVFRNNLLQDLGISSK